MPSLKDSSKRHIRTSAILVYPKQKRHQSRQLDILTCEYPPDFGGVANHTYRLAEGLQKLGLTTHIWAPGQEHCDEQSIDAVTRSLGRFKLRHLLLSDRAMGKAKHKPLLLQWEPVGYGMKALNVPFCLWVASRVLRGSRLIVMFHETVAAVENARLSRRMANHVRRWMAFTLANCAESVFAANQHGVQELQKLCFRPQKIQHLPVFSDIDSGINLEESAHLRAQLTQPDESLIGHFGRYMTTTKQLVIPTLVELLKSSSHTKIMFIGECDKQYRAKLLSLSAQFGSRVIEAGARSSKDVARYIAACDFMFQPYPGGITTKRSSAMAALANGKPVVSNYGLETEDIWKPGSGVLLLPETTFAQAAEQLSQLAQNTQDIKKLGSEALTFYAKNFSVERTVAAIMNSSVLADSTAYQVAEVSV